MSSTIIKKDESKLPISKKSLLDIFESKKYSQFRVYINAISDQNEKAESAVAQALKDVLVLKKIQSSTSMLSALILYKYLLVSAEFDYFDNDEIFPKEIHQEVVKVCEYRGNQKLETKGLNYFVDLFKAQPNDLNKKNGNTFVILALQIVKNFSKWYPVDYYQSGKSRYLKAYEKLKSKNVTFVNDGEFILMKKQDETSFRKNYEDFKTKMQEESEQNKEEMSKLKLAEQSKISKPPSNPIVSTPASQKNMVDMSKAQDLTSKIVPNAPESNKKSSVPSQLSKKNSLNKIAEIQNKPDNSKIQTLEKQKQAKLAQQAELKRKKQEEAKKIKDQSDKLKREQDEKRKKDEEMKKKQELDKINREAADKTKKDESDKLKKQEFEKKRKQEADKIQKQQALKLKALDDEKLKIKAEEEKKKRLLEEKQKAEIELIKKAKQEQERKILKEAQYLQNLAKQTKKQDEERQRQQKQSQSMPQPQSSQIPKPFSFQNNVNLNSFESAMLSTRRIPKMQHPSKKYNENSFTETNKEFQIKKRRSLPKTQKRVNITMRQFNNTGFENDYEPVHDLALKFVDSPMKKNPFGKTLSYFRSEKKKQSNHLYQKQRTNSLLESVQKMNLDHVVIPFVPEYFDPIKLQMESLRSAALFLNQNAQSSHSFYQSKKIEARLIKSSPNVFILVLKNISNETLAILPVDQSSARFSNRIQILNWIGKKSTPYQLPKQGYLDIKFMFDTFDFNFKFLLFLLQISGIVTPISLPITLLDMCKIQKQIDIRKIEKYGPLNGKVIQSQPFTLRNSSFPLFMSNASDQNGGTARSNQNQSKLVAQCRFSMGKIDPLEQPNSLDVFIKVVNASKRVYELNILYDSKIQDNEDFAKVMLELLIFLLIK